MIAYWRLLSLGAIFLLYTALAWGQPRCQELFSPLTTTKQQWKSSLSLYPAQRAELIQKLLTEVEIQITSRRAEDGLPDLLRDWVEIFNLPHSQVYFAEHPSLRTDQGALQQLSRGSFFQRIAQAGESLSIRQKEEILQMLSEHQWLRWPVPGSSALRDSLWTFYWGLRLRWTPERGFASLLKRLTIDQSQRTQSLDDTASLDLLNRWDAEIPLAFSKLPSAQQQTYRATLLKQINGPERDLYSQRLFIQTHQRELNQLAADLATLQNEGDAKRSGLILAVDRFYESLGFQTGPERGGYSFGHVLNLIEPSQTWIRQKTPFLRSANHLFFFGSFPNGRAHWLQSSDQLNWQHSDLDVTFSHHQEFSQAGLRGESWVFTSEPQSQRRRDLLELEQNLGAVLGIDSFTPGRLLAPMSGVSPDQLTRMKTPEPGSLYPTLASPLSLEVGPRQAWLYLHYLPPGAREPQTFRFEVPNE